MTDIRPNPATQNMRKRATTEKSLRDFYYILFRHKRGIIRIFFVILFTSLLGTLLMPDIYLSSAKLMVRLGRESVTLDPTATTGQVVNIGHERESEINSELEILTSRELADRVVEAVGINAILYASNNSSGEDSLFAKVRSFTQTAVGLPFAAVAKLMSSGAPPTPAQQLQNRDKAVRYFMKSLRVEVPKKSNVLNVSYKAQDPKLAQTVTEKLLEVYLDKHINAYRTSGSYQFFSEQTEQARSELARTEEALRDLKSRTGMASLMEQRRIILERTGGLQGDIEQTDSAAAASSARIEALTNSLASIPITLQKEETTGFANSAADELLKRLNELQLKEQELLSTFTEQSIPVTEVRRQLKAAQSLLQKAQQTRQVTKGVNSTYQQLQLDLMSEKGNLSSLQAKAFALKGHLAKAQGELSAINESEFQLTDLERRVEVQRASYRKYYDSLEQARIDQALEMEKISNISILQSASFPVKPISPNKKLNIALGILLGAFGGLSFAFLSEQFDRSFRKPEDIEERLHLPILAAIPHVETKALTHIERPPGMRYLASDLRQQIHTSQKCPAELRRSYETFMEQFITPRREYSSNSHVLCITSSHHGEGSSTVATHIALTLAYCDEGRVLLVDTNLRNPSIHEVFGMALSPGLADALADSHTYTTPIRPSPIPNLDLLSAGRADDDITWRPETELFTQLMALWKRDYNFIIIDAPAVWEGSHSVSLGRMADAVILVIEAEKVRWETVQRARDRLIEANARIIGVVLNKRRFYIPEWLYRML